VAFFYGETEELANNSAKNSNIPKEKIKSINLSEKVKEFISEGQGETSEKAVENAKNKIPSTAFGLGTPSIIDGLNGNAILKCHTEKRIKKYLEI